jgi:Cu(I)/Ag(I) efflux system membrane fusion protein
LTRRAGAAQAASSEYEWFCPMHPAVVRDDAKEPCPICHMPLSKRKKGEAKEEALPPGIVNRVQLSPYRVVLAGVQTWTVDYVPLTKKLSTVGYVEFNEREQKQVTARVKGRLDKLFVNETGRMVEKDEDLASLYSPDLVNTVQNLLDAKRSGNAQLLRIARERLSLWGISDDQIDEILRTGQANTHLKIRSPIAGHVIKKYVKEGQYVEEGSPLYDIADLSTVWIEAQVYEEDVPFLPSQERFHKGPRDKKSELPVTATTAAAPTERFPGTLAFVYPHVDQETRTVTVRFELENPGHNLRPGTTATDELLIPPRQVPLLAQALAEDAANKAADKSQVAERREKLRQGLVLAVPEGTVIDTGDQQIVYRETAPGEYEGVKVTLAPRMVDAEGVTFYPLLRGLEPGDKVVAAGSFLVDAETRLNPAAGSIYFGGTGLNRPGRSSTSSIRPSTPQDEETNVKVNLAKLPEADRAIVEAQGFCPVNQTTRLGSMGVPFKVMIQGKPVFLCCKNCEDVSKEDPEKTLAAVERLKAKVKKAKMQR